MRESIELIYDSQNTKYETLNISYSDKAKHE